MRLATEFQSDLLIDWIQQRKSLCQLELELQSMFPIREITSRKDYSLGMKLLEHLMDKKEGYKGSELKAIKNISKIR